MSICPCVCLSQAGILLNRLYGSSSFLSQRLSLACLILYCVFGTLASPKIGSFGEFFPQILDLEKFLSQPVNHNWCYQQLTDNGSWSSKLTVHVCVWHDGCEHAGLSVTTLFTFASKVIKCDIALQ